MAIETHVHDGSAWRKAKQIHVHDGSAWRDCKEVWCHDGSAWRKVFQKGYWRLIGAARSDIPSTWSFSDFAFYDGDLYILARDPYGYGYVDAGLYKWTGTSWALQGSLFSINAGVQSRIFAHTDGIHAFYADSGGYPHTLWDGSAWSTLTTAYFVPVDAVSVGSTLYICDSYDTYGTCVQYWNGSAWTALGSNVYECSRIAKVGSDLFIIGSPVSGGFYYDWEALRWNGSTWATITRASGTSYYEANFLLGDDSTIFATVDSGYIVSYTGSAMARLSGDPILGGMYITGRHASADGMAVLPIYDGGGDYFGRINAGAIKPFTNEVTPTITRGGHFWDPADEKLYAIVCGSTSGSNASVYIWEGALPE